MVGEPRFIAIAAERTPEGDFRAGDLEALPWPDDSFDVVTGFSAFQFADDKIRAMREAKRVSRDVVAIVIPTRVPESGIAAVFTQLFPLYPREALESMKQSGMFALSEPGKLDELLATAGLTVQDDAEIECPVSSGVQAIGQAVRDALAPFTGIDGHVTLPAWYRVVFAKAIDG